MGPIHNNCRGLCDWRVTEEFVGELPLFRCTGCRSEWTPAERWTPRNADGEVSEEVLAARAAPRTRRRLWRD